MTVIEGYIFRRTLTMFGAALFWTLAIVWTTQVLTRINLVTDNGQSALAFFEIAALILPTVIPIVVPFALVIAVAQVLTTMNSDSELVVISAAGSSRSATVRPIVFLAVLAGLFSFAVDNALDPFARQRGRELVAVARADLLSLVIQEGTFRKIEDGLFIQIGEKLSDGRLGSVFVADSRTEGTDLVYYAKSGSVVQRDGKNLLIMNEGEIHRKLVAGDVSVIRFTSYAFDLSVFSGEIGNPSLYPKDRGLLYLFNPDPDDVRFQNDPQSFRAELHRRFTEWLYPLVFALIALAVTGDARSHREARVNPLVTAIMIALFVRWLAFFTISEAKITPWFWPFVYAVPVGSSLVAAWFIFTNRSMELPVSAAEKLLSLLRRLGDRMMFLQFWRARRAAKDPV